MKTHRERLLAAASVSLIALLAGCAGLAAAGKRDAQGEVVDGKFAPKRAPATAYGADPTMTCPPSELLKLVGDQLESAKSPGSAVAQQEGRLCAVSEALLGWSGDSAPPESVMRFVSWHFGLPAPVSRVFIATLATEKPDEMATALAPTIASFMATATQPRYGLATLRVSKEATQRTRGSAFQAPTRVVLLLQDATVDIDSVPRMVAPGGQAAVSGKVPEGIDNAQVVICDAEGKLDQPKGTGGKSFQADLKCPAKPGRITVEVRGEIKGALTSLAAFPVSCGGALPTAVAVPAAQQGAGDVAALEKKVFDEINEERTNAGRPALTLDETVAKAARSISDAEKQQVQSGNKGAPVDPVAKLKEAGVVVPTSIMNSLQALTVEDAQSRLILSPVHRCRMLSAEVNRAGVGVAQVAARTKTEVSSAILTELFVTVLPPVNPEELRTKLSAAIDEKRAAAKVSALKPDDVLAEVAQKYADEIASSGGKEDDERIKTIIRPLYQKFSTVEIVAGAKPDAMQVLDEPGIVAKGKGVGLGVAQGEHPVFGKNTAFIAVIIGTRK